MSELGCVVTLLDFIVPDFVLFQFSSKPEQLCSFACSELETMSQISL